VTGVSQLIAMQFRLFGNQTKCDEAATTLAGVRDTNPKRPSEQVERRRFPRPLPQPEVVEMESDTAWSLWLAAEKDMGTLLPVMRGG